MYEIGMHRGIKELVLENVGSEEIFLPAGETVMGRTRAGLVLRDCILPPNSGKVLLPSVGSVDSELCGCPRCYRHGAFVPVPEDGGWNQVFIVDVTPPAEFVDGQEPVAQ